MVCSRRCWPRRAWSAPATPSKAATGCGRTSPGHSISRPSRPTAALRDQLDWRDIREIEIFTSKFTWFEIGSEPEKWDPKTRETADHSLPYIFARTLVSGPIHPGSFSDELVLDPALRPLMQTIKVTVDEQIEALLPRVVLRARCIGADGREHDVEVDNPLGHPDNPMDDAAIAAKFTSLAAPVIGQPRAQDILGRCWHAADQTDLPALLAMLDLPAGS
jgi:2-methylcitrate dehydratase